MDYQNVGHDERSVICHESEAFFLQVKIYGTSLFSVLNYQKQQALIEKSFDPYFHIGALTGVYLVREAPKSLMVLLRFS